MLLIILRIKNNGTVYEINVPSDKLEVMEKIAKSNVTEAVKQNIIKRMSGGLCCVCRGIPTHEVIYNVEDASRLNAIVRIVSTPSTRENKFYNYNFIYKI